MKHIKIVCDALLQKCFVYVSVSPSISPVACLYIRLDVFRYYFLTFCLSFCLKFFLSVWAHSSDNFCSAKYARLQISFSILGFRLK